MMRPKTNELGMFSTHADPAGETEEDDADADSEYDDADEDTDAEDADEEEEDEEEEEEEEAAGNSARSLRVVCALCGEVNRLRPPRGFLFSEREDDDAEDRQIRYRCDACGEVNRFRLALARESAVVKIFRESYYGRQE